MAAALKNWQFMTALFKGSGAMPEVLLKLAQTSMGSLIELHQKMIQRLGRMGQSVEAYQFQDMDENLLRLWTDIHTKEFQQFFQIPQIGLMRTYQEKANQALDEYNIFQSTLSEFLNMPGLPFNRSVQVMQEKLSEMAENGELTDDTKVYYNMWVKVLGGHFMTLFQTMEETSTDKRMQYPKETEEEGTKSMVMRAHPTTEKIVGVMRLYSDSFRKYSQDSITFVEAFAHTGALAIQNVSMYLSLKEDQKRVEKDVWRHRLYFRMFRK